MATEAYREKVFPALAGALWLTFLFLDLTGMADSTWVKFAAICLCGVTAWTGARTPDGKLVAAALTLTVCADVFLLLLNRDMNDQMAGVGIFIAVQLLYAYRLYLLRGKAFSRWGLPLRLAALLLCLFLLVLIGWAFSAGLTAFAQPPEGTVFHLPAFLGFFLSSLAAAVSPVLLPTLFYFSNLCVNTAEAFALCGRKALGEKGSGPARPPREGPRPAADSGHEKAAEALGKKGLRRFAWGLLLFVGCDVCVGAWNLGLFEDFSRVGMWFFYLPSQVLITLSPTFPREKK